MPNYDPNQFTPNPQNVWPEQSTGAQEWARTESLLSPDLLVQRFLFGIPLRSRLKNPVTNKYDTWTPEILKDCILRAVADVETMAGIEVFPVQHDEPHPFDRVEFETYGYFRLRHKPVLTIDQLAIRPANNVQSTNIWIMPKEWISFTDAAKGQINIIPLIAGDSQVFFQAQTTNGAAFILSFLSSLPFAPGMWQVKYTSGFAEGNIPKVLNELIGCTAAIDVLSALAATNLYSSYSLGMDSMSQSQSGPGPQVYDTRIAALELKRKALMNKFKTLFGSKLAMSHI